MISTVHAMPHVAMTSGNDHAKFSFFFSEIYTLILISLPAESLYRPVSYLFKISSIVFLPLYHRSCEFCNSITELCVFEFLTVSAHSITIYNCIEVSRQIYFFFSIEYSSGHECQKTPCLPKDIKIGLQSYYYRSPVMRGNKNTHMAESLSGLYE